MLASLTADESHRSHGNHWVRDPILVVSEARLSQYWIPHQNENSCKYNVHLSTAYHPWTDGWTKQTNQEVETYLQIFCANNPHQWSKFLTSTEFQHNSVPHSSTKVSPFSLLFGYDPHVYPSLGKTFIPPLEHYLSSLDTARKEALAAHEFAQWIICNRMVF